MFPVKERARARRSDPITSWWAAQGVDVSRSEGLVLNALINGPAVPHIIWERILDKGESITPQRVRTALSEMKKRGLVHTTGKIGLSENGGPSREWARTVK